MSQSQMSEEKGILVKQKAIIAELSKEADCNEEVKRVLKAYNPAAVKYETNKKRLVQFSDPVLEDAALFLGGKPRTEDGTVKRYRDKDSLIDWLIMGIEGLFPQFCQACESDYVVTRGDKPKFKCSSCGGGSHNCTAIQQQPLSSVPGFVWICSGCMKKHTLENFSGQDGEFASPPKSAASDANEDSLRRKFSFMSMGEVDEEKEETSAGNRNENKLPKIEEKKTKREADKSIPVCQQYLQHRCKHGRFGTKKVNGVACQKSHPPMCRKFCSNGSMKKYGCQLGKECRYFHPPLCRSSQFSHECYKTDCRFQHLRNTRRTPANVKPNTTRVPSVGRQRTGSSYASVATDTTTNRPRTEQPNPNVSQPASFDERAFFERLLVEMDVRMRRALDERLESQRPWRER